MRSLQNLDDELLTKLAGKQVFDRGVRYCSQGRVEIHSQGAHAVRATVTGTELYSATLALAEMELEWDCDCPAAGDGSFCKHLVATAIAARGDVVSQPTDEDTGLLKYLKAQSADKLAEWLMEAAQFDPAVEKRLRLRRSETDPKALKKAISSLLRTRDFMDYRTIREFVRNLGTAIESLRTLANSNPVQALDLCEYALERLIKLYANSDDSSGFISDRVHELVAAYKHCLRYGKTDGGRVTEQLLKLQKLDDWSFLPLAEFWPLFDEAGQRAYVRKISTEFAKLPPTKGKDSERGWIRAFPVVRRMEELAQLQNDTDLLIRVISRDLGSGYAYERLVEVCREAGRPRESTQWAERGYRHHPDWRGIRSILAEEYLRDGLFDEAVNLLREDFEKWPAPGTWTRLKQAAGNRWPEIRVEALHRVENSERISAEGQRDVSPRVALLLADHDFDAARMLCESHAAGLPLLEELARLIAKSHPASAASFLRRVVEARLPRSDTRHYPGIADQIHMACSLEPSPATDRWFAELKVRYRAKRKLMALLEQVTR